MALVSLQITAKSNPTPAAVQSAAGGWIREVDNSSGFW